MIIERTTYWPKSDQLAEVLALRREACRIRTNLGLPAGRIATERAAPGQGPIVHWECRFAATAEHAADLRARAESEHFQDVRRRMQAAISDFRRSVAAYETDQGTLLREYSLAGSAVVPRVVTFPSGDFELTGYLYLPDGPGPHPCLVTNHGSTINQGAQDLCRPGSASLFLGWGIASFLPHRRGYGNSPGTGWRDEVAAPFGSEAYDRGLVQRLESESRDVVAAVEYLECMPEIDPAHIGVIGSSFGGTVSLLAAARCDHLRCLVEFAGAAMNWEQAPGLREHMLEAARRLTQPAFFIQAKNDYSTRPTQELARAVSGSSVPMQHRIYPPFGLSTEEGHLFYGNGAAVWSRDVRIFLERWL